MINTLSPHKAELRVVRRQNTCLRKRLTAAELAVVKVRSAARVLRWARRWAQSPGGWNEIQLKIAVNRWAVKKFPKPLNQTP